MRFFYRKFIAGHIEVQAGGGVSGRREHEKPIWNVVQQRGGWFNYLTTSGLLSCLGK